MGIYDDDLFSIKETLEELDKESSKECSLPTYDWGCVLWIVGLIIVEVIYFLFFDN